MSTLAVRTEDLGKRYRFGSREPYKTLRDALAHTMYLPFRGLSSIIQPPLAGAVKERTAKEEWIWALKDVSLNVGHGDTVGIIGHNGAGKSTMLKVLSRITKPTEGWAKVEGRIGSLLEVGTGFHPELTGRENVYLNGAILGMKRAEINRKFDEIVAFAGVEQFIDTPVKRYSSGMHMRLAFAVAAHLEPEIMLVDEILAVGDAAFQKKCLGKMGNVAKEGRTIFFVSHNLLAIQNLCSRVLWLHDGKIVEQGRPDQVISNYLKNALPTSTERTWLTSTETQETKGVHLHRVRVRPTHGNASEQITVHTPFLLEVEYWNFDLASYLSVSVCLYTEHDILLFDISPPFDPDWCRKPSPMGLLRTVCQIPGDFLNDGLHRVGVMVLRNHRPVITESHALIFNIQDGSLDQRGGWYGKWKGVTRPVFKWETNVELSSKSSSTVKCRNE
jgi:lipopolysaccharide transport system ATP-binding protein